MIIFLYGADTFRSRRQLKKMTEKFKQDRDPQGLNVVSLDCAKDEDGKIMEQLLAVPFLAEKRMVVLENLLTATGKGDLQTEILKRVEEKGLDENNVYVFWQGVGKPKTKAGKELLARLLKEKYAQEFEEVKGVKLSAWISAEAKGRGGKISKHAVDSLAQNVGGDMWLLNSTIDQLIAYKGEDEIMTEDVNLFVEEKVDDNIFNLVDAAVSGQTKQVYKMIREQYRIGKDPHYVFAMILRQFRILIEIRDLYEREDNMPSDVMAKKLGIHPFVVKKSLPFIKKYNLEDLKKIYLKLLDLDIKFKTSQGDPSLLVDVFVGSL
ncbi:MAG: DNA polymerase III subunit delta [Candidatus Magasanikbacteria bacterium]|nr:DNA polymerase III subunit delta [Candidatus Magasanikbacteria bacterium]